MASLSRPFADFFNASTPLAEFDDMSADVADVLTSAGAFEAYPGLYRLDTLTGSGTCKLSRPRGGVVGCVSVSGHLLGVLRDQRRLSDLLWAVGSRPHRVTTLHATLDVAEEAPAVIARLYAQATGAEGLALSRKRIPGRHVSRVVGPGYPGHVETGTLYLGNRRADVWAKVYDKRSHLHSQVLERIPSDCTLTDWVMDPGPLTRYELSLGRHVGCTLRDVENPEAVFWHYAGDVLLPRPAGVPAWQPGGEGYWLGPRPERLPAQQLKLLLSRSPDVQRALRLASECGGYGFDYLVSLLRRQTVSLGGGQAPVVPGGRAAAANLSGDLT